MSAVTETVRSSTRSTPSRKRRSSAAFVCLNSTRISQGLPGLHGGTAFTSERALRAPSSIICLARTGGICRAERASDLILDKSPLPAELEGFIGVGNVPSTASGRIEGNLVPVATGPVAPPAEFRLDDRFVAERTAAVHDVGYRLKVPAPYRDGACYFISVLRWFRLRDTPTSYVQKPTWIRNIMTIVTQ